MVNSKEPPSNYLCEEMLWKDRLFCCELSRVFCPGTAIQYESCSHLFIKRTVLSWSTWGIGDVNELPRFARASGYQRLDQNRIIFRKVATCSVLKINDLISAFSG